MIDIERDMIARARTAMPTEQLSAPVGRRFEEPKKWTNDKKLQKKNNILKNVRIDSLIVFKNSADGRVFKITDPVGFEGDRTQARIFVTHSDGCESYHHYRYDGVSHSHESNDIMEVIND